MLQVVKFILSFLHTRQSANCSAAANDVPHTKYNMKKKMFFETPTCLKSSISPWKNDRKLLWRVICWSGFIAILPNTWHWRENRLNGFSLDTKCSTKWKHGVVANPTGVHKTTWKIVANPSEFRFLIVERCVIVVNSLVLACLTIVVDYYFFF